VRELTAQARARSFRRVCCSVWLAMGVTCIHAVKPDDEGSQFHPLTVVTTPKTGQHCTKSHVMQSLYWVQVLVACASRCSPPYSGFVATSPRTEETAQKTGTRDAQLGRNRLSDAVTIAHSMIRMSIYPDEEFDRHCVLVLVYALSRSVSESMATCTHLHSVAQVD
jgi:hypothetical protein